VIFGAGVAGLGAGAGAGLGAGAGAVLGAVLGRVIVGNCGPGFCHGSTLGAGVPGFNGSTLGVAGEVLGAVFGGAVLTAAKASSHADVLPVTNSVVRGSTFAAVSAAFGATCLAAAGAALVTTSLTTAGAAFLTTSLAAAPAIARAAAPIAIPTNGATMITSYPYCAFVC
jgi:hypothetical protein